MPTSTHFLHRLSGSQSANQCGKRMDGALYISVTAKIYTHMVDKVFEQNRMRMAQYAVTKSQQVESLAATN